MGSYADTATSTCRPCVEPCITCSTLTLCDTCVNGYYLYESRCLLECPLGYTPSDA